MVFDPDELAGDNPPAGIVAHMLLHFIGAPGQSLVLPRLPSSNNFK